METTEGKWGEEINRRDGRRARGERQKKPSQGERKGKCPAPADH